jgi:hypothetical protein
VKRERLLRVEERREEHSLRAVLRVEIFGGELREPAVGNVDCRPAEVAWG